MRMAGQDFDHGGESHEGADEPEGDQEAERRQKSCDDVGEDEGIDASDSVQGDERSAEGSEGYGGGVGEECEAGGFEGCKAEADEDGSADGDGGAEAGGALEEGAECEGDEEELKAAVFGDPDQALVQQPEAAGADGELVHEDDRKDDPEDRECSVGEAVGGCQEGEVAGHVEDCKGDDESGAESGES